MCLYAGGGDICVHCGLELTTSLCFHSGVAEKNECDFSVHHVHWSCGGESKCIDGLNQFICKCAPGWTGGGVNKVCVGECECEWL